MSKYEKYKPSGIDWIGEVPMHWKRKRFRYCFDNGKGLSITKENLIETGIPCVNYGEIHSKYGFKVDPEKDELLCVDLKYLETNQSSLLSNGHFVFADTSEDIEGSGNFTHIIGNHKIFAGYHTIVSRLKINAHPRYVAYFFDSVSYRNQIRSEVQGVKVFSITNKILKDTILFFPELTEQITIAHDLDHQTQKIDRLIANKKAQAEKLKELRQIEINNAVTKGLNSNAELKDSGIDWLGKIPKHWKVKRLKSILININSGDGITNDDLVEDGEFEIYGGNGVMGYTDKYNSEGKVIVIGRVGAKCGVVYLVDKKIWISDNALQSRTYNSYEFVYYLIDAMNLNNYANQNAQPLITGGILKVLYAGVPPKDEQIQIAKHLQERTTAIDKLISNIDAQIEKLQELRKIKIYEAVTGKIKVNAYVEATA